VLRAIPTNDNLFDDRSEPIVSLLTNICHVPEYFHKTTQIICVTRDDTPDYWIDDVMSNLHRLRLACLQWQEEYFGSAMAGCPNMPIDRDRQHEALGFSFAVSIVINRLLFSLDPIANAYCEETAQKFASKILQIKKISLSNESQAELFMAIKLGVARTAQATATKWNEWCRTAQLEPSTTSPLMPKEVFTSWCHRMNWETP
jgi:hypothetical protein